MKIVIGCDHAGFEYKEKLKQWLIANCYECEDVGTFSMDSVDYPIYAKAVCKKFFQMKLNMEFFCVELELA